MNNKILVNLRRIIPTSIIPALKDYGKLIQNGIATKSLEHTTSDIEDDIKPKELVEILNWRFAPESREAISAVFGEPDFLPFPFLAKGMQCGAAVCRLVRNVDVKDTATNDSAPDKLGLKELINAILQAEKNWNTNFTAEELARIFAVEAKDSLFEKLSIPPSKVLIEKRESLKELMRLIEVGKGESKRQMRVIPFGTGFLVGRNYLLTNHHVLKKESEVDEFIAEFGYEQDILGRNIESVLYELDPSFFCTNEKLDYTLVKVKRGCANGGLEGHAGDYFGWLPMIEDHRVIAPMLTQDQANNLGITGQLNSEVKERLQKPSFPELPSRLPGDSVNIIQHPKGKRKEIVLSNNRVQRISHNFLYYEADADFSSSGSPVLNQQWQLVGLHHAAVIGEYGEKDSKKWTVIEQEGVRICRIVSNIKSKIKGVKNLQEAASNVEDFKQLSFLEKYVIRKMDDSDYTLPPNLVNLLTNTKTKEFLEELRSSAITKEECLRKIEYHKGELINQIKECIKNYEKILKKTGEISKDIALADRLKNKGVNALLAEVNTIHKEGSELEKKATILEQEFMLFVIQDEAHLSGDDSKQEQIPPSQPQPYSS